MRKVIHKGFWVWNFDKEEKWLNQMAAKGLALCSASFFRYEFEECLPGEYNICLELVKHRRNHPETVQYIRFLEETGVEHIGHVNNYIYFRKKADNGFELYSDSESRINYLTRYIRFISVLIALNISIGLANLCLCFYHDSPMNSVGFISIFVSVIAVFGMFKLIKKRKKLKAEHQLFE